MSVRILSIVAVLVAMIGAALFMIRSAAEAPRKLMGASEAHAKATTGEVVLVDIRTPDEWRETGVPASAHAISLNQEPRFLVQKLKEAMGGDTSRPLALICRTGNRSSTLQAELVKAGFTDVIDVGEGMAGSRHGQGWLKSGLPRRTGAAVSMPPLLASTKPEAR